MNQIERRKIDLKWFVKTVVRTQNRGKRLVYLPLSASCPMPSLAEGEGCESEGHALYCDGSFQGWVVPTALTGVAQLKATVLSIPAAGSFVLSHPPGMAVRAGNLVYPCMFPGYTPYTPFNRA